uniref:Uncharacterized protein LOC111125257 n=1 Tax=Crassostrea virginica TaxID=6565 RepID=A0A8B8DAH4_CRAVI|nr:uncharacterized protein LOC111125257 [Crassostrea virginica]
MDHLTVTKESTIEEMTHRFLGLKEELKLLGQSLDGLHKFYAPNPIEKIKNKLAFMENSETQYEQTVNKPVKFLRFVKRCPLYNTRELPKVLEPNRYVTKKGCADPECFFPVHEGLMEYRKPIRKNTKIKTSKRLFVELPALTESFLLPGPMNCVDLCFVPPNLFWVNNGNNIILTNTQGDILHRINSSYSFTANENEIMYVDRNFSIQKLSYGRENSILFMRRPSLWLPLSIHCCQSNGDLLVGMVSSISNPPKARVVRCNEFGEVKQSIFQNEEGRVLYRYPRYITENRNGDIVVSDVMKGRIVVTNNAGEFRFFSPVDNPKGICTDQLSRILVVCRYSQDVLVLDENGMYLLHLRIEESPEIVRRILRKVHLMFFQTIRLGKSQERRKILCLSYDDDKNLLWVGSNDSNTVSGYKEEEQKQTDDFNNFHGILRFVDIFLRICFFLIHLILKLTVEIWFLIIHPIFELIVKIFMGIWVFLIHPISKLIVENFMGIWFFIIHWIFVLIMSIPILNIPIFNTVFAPVFLASTTTIPVCIFSLYFPTLSATLIVIVLLHICCQRH